MAATEPIRNKQQLRELADYYLKKGQLRNYALIVMGVCTVLRISDLLRVKWSDVYDKEKQDFRLHVSVIEKKTGKPKTIALNKQAVAALRLLLPHRKGEFIFASNRKTDKPISRVQAWRIIHAAVIAVGIMGKISCHSLRKTWGYHACVDQKVSPAIIMEIYNHSKRKHKATIKTEDVGYSTSQPKELQRYFACWLFCCARKYIGLASLLLHGSLRVADSST